MVWTKSVVRQKCSLFRNHLRPNFTDSPVSHCTACVRCEIFHSALWLRRFKAALFKIKHLQRNISFPPHPPIFSFGSWMCNLYFYQSCRKFPDRVWQIGGNFVFDSVLGWSLIMISSDCWCWCRTMHQPNLSILGALWFLPPPDWSNKVHRINILIIITHLNALSASL